MNTTYFDTNFTCTYLWLIQYFPVFNDSKDQINDSNYLLTMININATLGLLDNQKVQFHSNVN